MSDAIKPPTESRNSLIFKAPLIRSILADQKTQTRRLYKPQPVYQETRRGHRLYRVTGNGADGLFREEEIAHALTPRGTDPEFPGPYGAPGDRIWVRETFTFLETHPTQFEDQYQGPDPDAEIVGRFLDFWLRRVRYRADERRPGELISRWRPAIHMPRWASRITLEVTGVRVERVQAISDADIAAEGITPQAVRELCGLTESIRPEAITPIHRWRWVWEAINGIHSWEANPWVWVYEFRRVS